MQSHVPFFGNPVIDSSFELGAQGEHGAEYFAERSEVVAGDPAAKAEQLLVENGRRVEDT